MLCGGNLCQIQPEGHQGTKEETEPTARKGWVRRREFSPVSFECSKLRQFFSFLHVSFWFCLMPTWVTYSDITKKDLAPGKELQTLDGLQTLHAFQFNTDDHKRRLLVLGPGLFPLKCFLLGINKLGALARPWAASCICSKLQCFPCLGRFHNFFLIMHEIWFHL